VYVIFSHTAFRPRKLRWDVRDVGEKIRLKGLSW
jgi:hypothetical protein